jgi:cobalt/nickel transport system permease protein
MRTGVAVVVVALAVTFGVAAFASPFASTKPDGLNKVAADHGFDRTARASATKRSPLAGYGVKDIGHAGVAKGLAGVIGVMGTMGFATVVFGALHIAGRRRRAPRTDRAH